MILLGPFLFILAFNRIQRPGRWICAVAKRLDGEGFLVTAYLTDAIEVFLAASSLDEVSHRPPERRHELTGSRKEEFAADGGLDLGQIAAIKIIGVEDYH